MNIAGLVAELGVLVTIAVVFIVRTNRTDKKNEEKFDRMFNMLLSNEHSPEKEEKAGKVEEMLGEILRKLMLSTDAGRAFIIRYHNGGKDLNGLSFLKMSMTNEVVRHGVAPLLSEFTNQFRSVYNWWVTEISKCDIMNVEDVDALEQVDYAMFQFFRNRGVRRIHARVIKNQEGMIVGFVGVEYLKEVNMKTEDIENCLRDKTMKIETVFSLK